MPGVDGTSPSGRRPLRVAVAGLGAIGFEVARAVDAGEVAGLALAAVAARDLERAREERQEMRGQLDSIQSAVGGLAYIHADHRMQFEELEARVKRIEDKIGLPGTPAE